MGRPKADVQGPGAEERVVEAFWGMLAEMPFPDIKVAALARRAHVSPNTIYYHFDGIYDVARRALESDLDSRFAGAVIMGDTERLAKVGAEGAKRLGRMVAFARSGSAELTAMLLDELRGRWLDAVGLSEDELDDEQGQDLAFAFGGLLAMLADCEPNVDASVLSGFFTRPLGRGVAETMRRLAGAGFDEGRPFPFQTRSDTA